MKRSPRRVRRAPVYLPVMRKALFGFLTGLVCLSTLGLSVSNGQAQAGSAYDLLAAVNQLRTSNGLPPYQINAALMAAAQSHSNYQASIGSITHTGQGGTRAQDRAVAAGYGGGAAVSVSENIGGGTSMNYQRAVQIWQGDSLHLNTMLGENYQDAGAGVATSGGMTYYTLDVGYIAGSSGSSGSGASESSAASGPDGSSPTATVIAFFPIQIATPGPDGSVIHVVNPGQTLWSIAATYEIELSELLNINGFTSNTFIFPGDKILIKAAEALPSTKAEEASATEAPPNDRKPTQTPTVKPANAIALAKPSQTITAKPSNPPGTLIEGAGGLDPALIAIAALVFGGTALIVLGNVLKRGG